MAAMVAMFTSCTKNDSLDACFNANANVSVTVELPEDEMPSRALPASPDAHELRCILEVWSKGENPKLQGRLEKLGSQSNETGNLSFDFYVEDGSYDLRLWADYIDLPETSSVALNRFPDKYYNTEDLTSVSVIGEGSMFNTDACDAFFGTATFTIDETSIVQEKITLSRALAKITVSDKNLESFPKVNSLSVSYSVPSAFNVTDSSATGKMVAKLDNAKLLGNGKDDLRLFSSYNFVNGSNVGTLGEIVMTFDFTDGSTPVRTVAIPANMPVQRNHKTNIKGHIIEDVQNNSKVEVDVDDSWESSENDEDVTPVEPTKAPAVGDYYYNDGTWSSTLKDDKTCIGLVFATDASKFEDNVENYGGKLSSNGIRGYVVALQNATTEGKASIIPDSSESDFASLKYSNKSGYVDYMALLSSDAYKKIESGSENQMIGSVVKFGNKVKAPEGTSGWYIASQMQFVEMAGLYCGFNGSGFMVSRNEAFVNAVDRLNGINSYEGDDGISGVNIVNSVTNLFTVTISDGKFGGVQIGAKDADETSEYWAVVQCKDFSIKGKSVGFVRPILTF